MKKILLLLLGLILIPFSAFAISLSEIQSDPGRYVKVAEGQTTTMYVDSYSIQSLRYAPPYYTIQGKIYYVSYTGNCIEKSTVIFNYDYDRSSVNLRKDLMPNNPYITDADRGNALWNEIKANTGIKFTETDVYTYSLSGDYIETEKNFLIYLLVVILRLITLLTICSTNAIIFTSILNMTQKTCIKTYFQFFDKDGIYEKDLFTLTHFFLYSILCLCDFSI